MDETETQAAEFSRVVLQVFSRQCPGGKACFENFGCGSRFSVASVDGVLSC